MQLLAVLCQRNHASSKALDVDEVDGADVLWVQCMSNRKEASACGAYQVSTLGQYMTGRQQEAVVYESWYNNQSP